MGRTIPSFRLLIDIEELEWKQFRKYLCRQDKKVFNNLFIIPKLYCHSLSNLSHPLIIHSIFMAILFHREKIVQLVIKDKVETKQNNSRQKLFKDKNYEQVIENLRKFIDCLRENDKNAFIKMIKECYFKYSKPITSNKNGKFDPCLVQYMIMAIILYQQKQIDEIKEKQNKISRFKLALI
ncbi:MAG: hypothetical protein H0X03_00230 [Nitrosopumilus sp.]|nr:hypothetical protein [Nitrosopumilus sp.]